MCCQTWRQCDAIGHLFDELKTLLTGYASWFTVREGAVKNKRDDHLIVRKPLVIDRRKKDELWFASVIQQKAAAGFYAMALYCCEDVKASCLLSC